MFPKQITCAETAQCWRALWQSTQGLQHLTSLDIMMHFNIYIFPAPPTHIHLHLGAISKKLTSLTADPY